MKRLLSALLIISTVSAMTGCRGLVAPPEESAAEASVVRDTNLYVSTVDKRLTRFTVSKTTGAVVQAETRELPFVALGLQVIRQGRALVFSGADADGQSSGVYVLPLNADGSLGAAPTRILSGPSFGASYMVVPSDRFLIMLETFWLSESVQEAKATVYRLSPDGTKPADKVHEKRLVSRCSDFTVCGGFWVLSGVSQTQGQDEVWIHDVFIPYRSPAQGTLQRYRIAADDGTLTAAGPAYRTGAPLGRVHDREHAMVLHGGVLDSLIAFDSTSLSAQPKWTCTSTTQQDDAAVYGCRSRTFSVNRAGTLFFADTPEWLSELWVFPFHWETGPRLTAVRKNTSGLTFFHLKVDATDTILVGLGRLRGNTETDPHWLAVYRIDPSGELRLAPESPWRSDAIINSVAVY